MGKPFIEIEFSSEMALIAQLGGVLMTAEDYGVIQQLVKIAGDDKLCIVQNEIENFQADDYLRLEIPADTAWETLMSGDFISTVLFEMPHFEYFVFGSSGKWGFYAATDFQHPMILFAVQPDIRLFLSKLLIDLATSEWISVLPKNLQDKLIFSLR